MGGRVAMLSLLAAGLSCLVAAQPSRATGLFDASTPVELTLTAPLSRLFARSAHDDTYSVQGWLTYRDPAVSGSVVLGKVIVSERGHTSRRESECTFPKLKIALPKGEDAPAPFTGMKGFKIGTHCGEAPDDTLTPGFGRLANEKSPLREALTYQMLTAAGVPTLEARPARITYLDQEPVAAHDGSQSADSAHTPLVRNAMLLEDEDAAGERIRATRSISMEAFGNVRRRNATADAVRLAFGEAMVGNYDWCLRFAPGDRYRCDDYKPLWNVLAFERPDGGTALLASDFDLAGTVVGRHAWFSKVYNAGFVASRSQIAVEVLSQVQRTRSLFDRAALDAERQRLISRKGRILAAIESATVDPRGRDLAREYVTEFFKDISIDGEFYRPVVTQLNVQVYADADRSQEACGPRDAIPVGTPVTALEHTTSMAEVLVLDALWRWAPPHQCKAVQTGPVWIDANAISREYPIR